MRLPRCLLPAIMLIGIPSLGRVLAAEPKAGVPAMENAVRLSDQTLPAEKSVELALPSLPAKPGKIVVLRFRTVSYSRTAAGCNSHATVALNGTPLARHTSGGSERLIGRCLSYEFTQGYGYPDTSFSGLQWLSADDHVCTRRRYRRSNVQGRAGGNLRDGHFRRGPRRGWKQSFHSQPPQALGGGRAGGPDRSRPGGRLDGSRATAAAAEPCPAAPAAEDRGQAGSIRLACGQAGGFTVSAADGLELLVETAVGMKPQVASELIASEMPSKNAQAKVHVQTVRAGRLRDDRRVAGLGPRTRPNRGNQGRACRVERTVDEHRQDHRGRALPPSAVPAKRSDAVLPGGDHRPCTRGLPAPRTPRSSWNPRSVLEMGLGWLPKAIGCVCCSGCGHKGNVAEIFSQTLALAPERASISR